MSIDAKTANLLAQAERAEQRALDAAEQRELKIKQWEANKVEMDAKIAERTAAKEAGDAAFALKCEEGIAKMEQRREQLRLEKDEAAANYQQVKEERDTKLKQRESAREEKERDLDQRRQDAAKKVDQQRIERKKIADERIALSKKKHEDWLELKNSAAEKREQAKKEQLIRLEEARVAKAEAKVLRDLAVAAQQASGRDAKAAALALSKSAAADAKEVRTQERAKAAEDRVASTLAAEKETEEQAIHLENAQRFEKLEMETHEKECVRLEEEAIAMGDAGALLLNEEQKSVYDLQDPEPLPSNMKRLAAEANYDEVYARIEDEWNEIAAAKEAAKKQAEAAGAWTVLDAYDDPEDSNHFNERTLGQPVKDHSKIPLLTHKIAREKQMHQANCAIEHDQCFVFDYGVYKGTMFKVGNDGIKEPETLGYCDNYWQLCYHFPQSLKVCYPNELKNIWTNDAILDWATRMTAEMANIPNPPIQFKLPYNEFFNPEITYPLSSHPIYMNKVEAFSSGLGVKLEGRAAALKYQIRARCLPQYTKYIDEIATCEDTIASIWNTIHSAGSECVHAKKRIEYWRNEYTKMKQDKNKHADKLDTYLNLVNDAKVKLAEQNDLNTMLKQDIAKATIDVEKAETMFQKNAELVKENDSKLKDVKKIVADGRKNKIPADEMKDLKNQEKEANDLLKATKKNTAVVKKQLQNATKILKDFTGTKRTKIKNDSIKLEKIILSKTQLVDKETKAIAKIVEKMERPQGPCRKIDEFLSTIEENEEIEETNGRLLAPQHDKIRSILPKIIDYIAASRDAEIQDIVQQHVKVRDQLLKELQKEMSLIEAIEQLRADRIQTHGQKELDRRVELIHKIVTMKKEENERRDRVNRHCKLCQYDVGNKYQAR